MAFLIFFVCVYFFPLPSCLDEMTSASAMRRGPFTTVTTVFWLSSTPIYEQSFSISLGLFDVYRHKMGGAIMCLFLYSLASALAESI